jgi:hypothetical protein
MQQRCPNCGAPVAPGQRFCGGCGAQISLACPQCRITVSPGTRFCPNCGATLGGGMPQQPGGMPQQPGWGQQPGGMPQQPGWGQQPGGMPQQQQPGWGQQQQPGWGQQPAWAPPAQTSQSSSRKPFLLILLIILLMGLGVLTYFKTPIGTMVKDLISGTGGTTVDTTPPEITVVEAEVGADVVIRWKTDDPASSQVEYGKTDAYGSVFPAEPATDPSTGESAGVVEHSVTLPKEGLEQEVTYHYRVKSINAAGLEAVSGDKTFTTLKPPE